MSTMRESVELVPAHLWVCPDCGRDNFVRATRLEPESMEGTEEDEEQAELTQELDELLADVGAESGGHWLVAPTRVTCQHCGIEYDVAQEDD